MLATGVLLVPIGIVLLGIAMRKAPAFGSGLAMVAIGLGALGTIGAVIAIIDPGIGVLRDERLAIVVFNLVVGWRTWQPGTSETVDLTDTEPAPAS